MKSVKTILLVLVLILVAIQFLPSGIPENQPENEKSIMRTGLVTGQVSEQLRKSCFDCHSNQVNFPWYAEIAPSSWFLARHVRDGLEHLNFSAWEDYSRREKIGLLEEIREEVESGNMPLKSYLIMHRDARLDSAKVDSIVKWTGLATERILE